MCREALSLQAGMNFGVGGNHSVILMSVRRNAPYRDRIADGGTTLICDRNGFGSTRRSYRATTESSTLVDSWTERDESRVVFKFRLEAVEGEEDLSLPTPNRPAPRRIIPTPVKLEVWKRDGGKCVKCGVTDDLHFDHDLPFSRGGTSLTAANVQLLCARHNLESTIRSCDVGWRREPRNRRPPAH